MASKIPVCRMAIRFGEPAAGWIVICNPDRVDLMGEEEPLPPEQSVNNKLFPTEESAVKHAESINPGYRPVVKALRAAVTAKEITQKAHDRHLDQFNLEMVGFRDHCLLSERECDELLAVINHNLPGRMNLIAHYLRCVLCEAVEVIRCEDVLAGMQSANS